MRPLFSGVRKLPTDLLEKTTSLFERVQQLSPSALLEAKSRHAQAWLQLRFPDLHTLGLGGLSLLRDRSSAGRGKRAERSLLQKPLRDLLQHADWHEREGAALILSELLRTNRIVADDVLVDTLAAALRDHSAEVAAAAAEALGRTSQPRAVGELRKVLDNADGFFCELTRTAAVTALASCLSDAQLGLVFSAIHDTQASVSLAAIKAISARAHEAAVFHLLPVLRDQTGFFTHEVKLAALQGLRGAGKLSASVREEMERYARELEA